MSKFITLVVETDDDTLLDDLRKLIELNEEESRLISSMRRKLKVHSEEGCPKGPQGKKGMPYNLQD